MEKMSMGDLLDQYSTTEKLYMGDVVEGLVISSNADEVMVNINYMADGILPKTELPDGNPLDFSPGQAIKVYVLKSDDGEGNVLLSLKKAYEIIIWDEFQNLFDAHKSFNVKIKEVVKGGVIGLYQGTSVFIPASQLSMAYVEDLKPFVGMTLPVIITEYDAAKKKVVASHKTILKDQFAVKKADQLSRISAGDEYTGTVVRLADYGAFVDLGGIDGLIHVSQMSWKRVKHPSEVLKEGDVVKVVVLSVDRDKEKISLKLSEVKENPWETVTDRYSVDDIVTGRVTRLMNFGAFVEIEEGIEGLIHISELSESHINKPSEVVSIGDEVNVMILDMDSTANRLSLSLKAAKEVEDSVVYDFEEEVPVQNTTLSDLFGDKLKNLKF